MDGSSNKQASACVEAGDAVTYQRRILIMDRRSQKNKSDRVHLTVTAGIAHFTQTYISRRHRTSSNKRVADLREQDTNSDV